MKNDDKTRIMHLIEHIQRIQVILQGVSEEQFYQSTTLIDAVSYNFAILGEAANRLSNDIQNKHPEIPWGNIIGMRNILIHDYMKSKPHYLWEGTQNDLPPLLESLEVMLKSMESPGEKNNVPT